MSLPVAFFVVGDMAENNRQTGCSHIKDMGFPTGRLFSVSQPVIRASTTPDAFCALQYALSRS